MLYAATIPLGFALDTATVSIPAEDVSHTHGSTQHLGLSPSLSLIAPAPAHGVGVGARSSVSSGHRGANIDLTESGRNEEVVLIHQHIVLFFFSTRRKMNQSERVTGSAHTLISVPLPLHNARKPLLYSRYDVAVV